MSLYCKPSCSLVRSSLAVVIGWLLVDHQAWLVSFAFLTASPYGLCNQLGVIRDSFGSLGVAWVWSPCSVGIKVMTWCLTIIDMADLIEKCLTIYMAVQSERCLTLHMATEVSYIFLLFYRNSFIFLCLSKIFLYFLYFGNKAVVFSSLI